MENAQIPALIDAFLKELRWVRARQSDLEQQYPDQFIAVKGEEIVASGNDMPTVLKALERQGLPPQEVFIEFISKVKRIF